MSRAIKSLKADKTSGEDDIRAEILKPMNNCGVRWLTCKFQIAWKTGEVPKQRVNIYHNFTWESERTS